MSVAQRRAARRRGMNWRRKNGPYPIGASTSANRLMRKVAREKEIQMRKVRK